MRFDQEQLFTARQEEEEVENRYDRYTGLASASRSPVTEKTRTSWASGQSRDIDIELGDISTEEGIESLKLHLHHTILGPPASASPLATACFDWYCTLLLERFASVNDSHLVPCLSESYPATPQPLDRYQVFRLMDTIASMVATRPNLALITVAQALVERKQFHGADDGLVVQIVFMALGWLSLLFDPDRSPAQDRLAIAATAPRSGRPLRSEALVRFEQGLELVEQPLPMLLRAFGSVVPDLHQNRGHQAPENEYLMLSYLNYHTLARVANVQIEWVDSLCLHLEFNEAHKVLKVFRFPSFCYMAYASKNEQPVLSSLFSTYRFTSSAFPAFDLKHGDCVRDYFREVLLSYRLLFGQNRQSWKAFKQTWKRSGKAGRGGRNQGGSTDDIEDPLLARLCGRSWKTESAFYASLEAEDAPTHYSPRQDFPCLGKRLLRLQMFSQSQHPHEWKVLWYDRRDILRFYTFWAVLVIGGGTILVGAVQIILAGLQLSASYEQNRLQALSVPSRSVR